MAGKSEKFTNPHGLDRELVNKINAKFDPQKAEEVLTWVLTVTGEARTTNDFGEELKDGYLIMKLITTIDPQILKKAGKKKYKVKHRRGFQAREQIEIFGKCCMAMGMKQTDVFSTQALFTSEDLNQVVNTLTLLNGIAIRDYSKTFTGPFLEGGYKVANENVRDFDEEVLAKGKSAVPIWSQGSLAVDTGSRLDGAGVLKTAGSEGHKISNEVGKWSKGSIHHESDNRLDGAGVLKTAGSEGHKISSTVGKWGQGSIAHESDNRLDGAGVIKTAGSEDHHISGAATALSRGAKKIETKKMDSYGVDRNVRH